MKYIIILFIFLCGLLSEISIQKAYPSINYHHDSGWYLDSAIQFAAYAAMAFILFTAKYGKQKN